MVPPDSDKVPRVSSYSGTVLVFLVFAYETITLYGPAFQLILLTFNIRYGPPHNPRQKNPTGLGCSEFARRYYRNLF